MIESKAMKYVSFVQELFYRIILDELHKMRFSKTKIDLTIFKLDVIVRFFFNVTFMINKLADLYDALMQLYNKAWTRIIFEFIEKKNENENIVMTIVSMFSSIHDFTQTQENLNDIFFNILSQYVYLFHFFFFWKMNHFSKNGQMNALIVNKVLSFILRQIQFRKVMNDAMIVNDEKIIIKQNISLYKIVIVELRLSTIQKNFYNFIHDRLINILSKNVNKKFWKKRMNMTAHRILCHVVTNECLFIMKKRLIFRDDLNVSTFNI